MAAWVGFLEREKHQWGPESIALKVLNKSGGFCGGEGEGATHNIVDASAQALGYGTGVKETDVNERKWKEEGKGDEAVKGKGKEVGGKGTETEEMAKDTEGIENLEEEVPLIDLWGTEDFQGKESIGWSVSETKEVRPL